MGKWALAGLDGVNKVENGWLNGREVNRVFYDPKVISVDRMEEALKKAGTFRGRAEEIQAISKLGIWSKDCKEIGP